MKNIVGFFPVAIALVCLTACSQKNLEEGFSNIRILIAGRNAPKEAETLFGANLAESNLPGSNLMEQLIPTALPSPAPPSVSNFDCLMVNVIGPGIPPMSFQNFEDWRPADRMGRILNQNSACTYPGIMSPPFVLTNTEQMIQMKVPSGVRVVQVLGVQNTSQNICGSGKPYMTYSDPLNVEYYEVGHAVLQLFSDTKVGIKNSYPTGLTSPDDESRYKRKASCPPRIYEPMIFGDPGLVAYWKMNTPAGGATIFDERGGIGPLGLISTSNVIFGDIGALVANFDTAMTFGIPNATTYAETSKGANLPGPFTFETWVKPSNCASSPAYLSMFHSVPNDSIELGCGSTVLNFSVTIGGAVFTATATLPGGGSWIHVVGVADPSVPGAGSGSLYIYVNGVSSGTAVYTPSPLDFTTTGSFTRLGANKSGAGILQGGLDEVAIYSRALGALEVQEHYKAGVQSSP